MGLREFSGLMSNKAKNGWQALRASKSLASARSLVDAKTARSVLNTTKSIGSDIAARSGIWPVTPGLTSNIIAGAVGGAAIGGGYAYANNQDIGRGAFRGSMYGAGAGLGYSVGRGVLGSYQKGPLGTTLRGGASSLRSKIREMMPYPAGGKTFLNRADAGALLDMKQYHADKRFMETAMGRRSF
jgi:hypothetical protein